MRDRAVLMELFIDGSEGNRHFHNLANWAGRKYIGKSYRNPIDVNTLFQNVVDAIEDIDLNSW